MFITLVQPVMQDWLVWCWVHLFVSYIPSFQY